MAIEHNLIPNAGLHEPKGVSTASLDDVYHADGAGSGVWKPPVIAGLGAAPAGQEYVSDGAGGASWKYTPHGWGYYIDAGTSPATQVFNTTPALLQIDGGGATSNSAYLPYQIRGTSELWDTANDKITPIAIGDSYDCRIDLTISATSGAPTYVELQLDIGGGASPTVVVVHRFFSIYKAPPESVSIGFPFFTLSTFVTNGGQIFLNCDAGTVTVSSRAILLSRNSAGNY